LGGHSWHHLQYLIGLKLLGHEVIFFEDYGWSNSCYDPPTNSWTSVPTYGLNYTQNLLDKYDLGNSWCYLAEDGTSYGIPRSDLAQACRESDLYINLSNINWIPELYECRRRILIDTDPVFTQINGYGMGGSFDKYHVLFTYGENVGKANCSMPSANETWLPTRQPVILNAWAVNPGNLSAPLTTVISWSNFGDREYNGRIYGQKDREFKVFLSLPQEIGENMEIAADASEEVINRLKKGGWNVIDPEIVTKDPWTYQNYLSNSRGEFCVAKHAYVSTWSGWFSDRSSAYLALGRPVIIQDTGFSDFLPTGVGLMTYQNRAEAINAIYKINENYEQHCRAARNIAEEYFDAQKVLSNLLEFSL
jgi:hypothetical protein